MRNLVWVAMVSGVVSLGAGNASAQDAPAGDPPADAQPAPPDGAPAPQPEPEPEPKKPEPWNAGVSDDARARARTLAIEGREFFVVFKYREALEKFQAAAALHDHPMYRFNIGKSLIHLDRPIEALENMEKAVAHGPDGLKDFFEEAQTHHHSLENQVATLEVSCSQNGVDVTVDGKPFLSCPGQKSSRVLPGQHQIVGKKTGFITDTQDLIAAAGAKNPVEVKLVTFDDVAVTVRRWDRWKPWAVAGGGVVVGGLGVLLELQARSTRSEYSDLLADNCSEEPCEASFGRSIFNRAKLEHGIALSAMIVGGAALVTGVAGVILNRPRKELPEGADQRGPQVVPTVTGDSAGLSISGTF